MKNALLLTLLALTAAPAFARTPRFYTIDMTGKRFGDQPFNMMDDGINDVDGFQIKLDGKMGRDFEITATHSERNDKLCTLGKARFKGGITLIQIKADLETDSGETCNYKITYEDGRNAELQVEETGT